MRIRLENIISSYYIRNHNMGSLELTYETHPDGVVITQTVIGGAGQQTGLLEGDIIERLDDIEIKKLGKNKENILDIFENQTVNLHIRRDKKLLEMKVKLGKRDLGMKSKQDKVEIQKFELK